jgi:putative ATP-binding cassette transporter
VSDDELRAVLAKVNLPDLVERCGGFDVTLDFGKILSLGEQQRLAVARVLLAKPRYAVLDEATSALDLTNEAALYALLAELETTLVSVTHRGAPVRHHRQILELHGDGSWTLREVEPSGVHAEPPLEGAGARLSRD